MSPRNTKSEMSLCPENIALSTMLHRTTKLARRRKKVLSLGGGAGGGLVSANMGQEIDGEAGSVEIIEPEGSAGRARSWLTRLRSADAGGCTPPALHTVGASENRARAWGSPPVRRKRFAIAENCSRASRRWCGS